MTTSETSTILVVDDQLSAREVLRGLLTLDGYNLAFASSGQEALAKAAEVLPDLVLLDVMMPGMNGFEVCRRLRSDNQLSEVLIIIMTALDDKRARLEAIEAGADDFVNKPIDPAELRARVRTITRLNRLRRLRALELQAERDRTKSILEALGEAVIVTDIHGIIQYLNPAATALTGYTSEEAIGKNWRLWQTEETETQPDSEFLQSLLAGETWYGEVVNKHKDGGSYDAALTVAPLFSANVDSNDSVIGFVIVQRDITPLKQAERSKDEFVSNVSHELRTPLSVITLLADNLELFYDRLNEAQRHKLIKDIQKHTQVLHDLIGDVLEISRIDSGRISMEREPLDLQEMVHEQAEDLRLLAEQKSQKLQVACSDDLHVVGNRAQLNQVIRNLVNNAIKYTADGGEISCECQLFSAPLSDTDTDLGGSWPDCHRLPEGRWAAFRVVDTGIGIEAEHLQHIFERFYRVQVEQNIRGTGLGLSISRTLIELHNGHIAVSSTPGEGSTFAVYLPLANGRQS